MEAAEKDLRNLVGDDYGVVSEHPIPDTVDMSLFSANHLLDVIKVRVKPRDDTGRSRSAINTEAWRVIRQAASGRSVELYVRKFGE